MAEKLKSSLGQTEDSERGQVLFQTALFLPVLLILIGLVVDGGLLLTSYRRAQIVADTAAHAASHRVSIDVFWDTNEVVLSPSVAYRKANEYIGYNQPPGTIITVRDITIGPTWVQVDCRASLPTTFLKIVGIPHVNVDVTGVAYAAYGIDYEWQ